MSNNIKIVAIAILALISGVRSANANDSIRVSANFYLTSGSEKSFEMFMNKSAKKFIKKNNSEWVTFNKVVRLYNESQGQFRNLTDSEKESFFTAVDTINEKLSSIKKQEAQNWLNKVNTTENIFKFIWSTETEERPIDEFIELPKISVEQTIGR